MTENLDQGNEIDALMHLLSSIPERLKSLNNLNERQHLHNLATMLIYHKQYLDWKQNQETLPWVTYH